MFGRNVYFYQTKYINMKYSLFLIAVGFLFSNCTAYGPISGPGKKLSNSDNYSKVERELIDLVSISETCDFNNIKLDNKLSDSKTYEVDACGNKSTYVYDGEWKKVK